MGLRLKVTDWVDATRCDQGILAKTLAYAGRRDEAERRMRDVIAMRGSSCACWKSCLNQWVNDEAML